MKITLQTTQAALPSAPGIPAPKVAFADALARLAQGPGLRHAPSEPALAEFGAKGSNAVADRTENSAFAKKGRTAKPADAVASTPRANHVLQQAFAFSQLGIFGVAGGARRGDPQSSVAAQPAQPTPPKPITAPIDPESSPPSFGVRELPATPVSLDAPPAGVPRLAAAAAAAEANLASVLGTPSNRPTFRPITPPAPGSAALPAARPEPTTPSGSKASPPLSVLVSQDGDDLRVVTASPELSDGARHRLLVAARALVSEYGLDLAGISHNGALIGRSAIRSIGAIK